MKPSSILLALVLLFAIGCASSLPSTPNKLFRSLGYDVILPIYDDLIEQSALLSASTAELCTSPSAELLAEAQEAWRRTRIPLKNSETFRFGPIKTLGVDQAIDFWPTRPENIEKAIEEAAFIDDLLIEQTGTSAKGLPAIEYLLFDPVNGNEEILAELTDPVLGLQRCEYLKALARNVQANAELVRDTWDSEQGFFLRNLINAGSSKVYPTVSAATSDFVNGMVALTESVQGMKIGGPLGKRSGGDADPELAESFFSDNSLADIIANLEGLQSVYLAKYGAEDGSGFDEYVRLQNPELADQIGNQIEIALDSVRDIPPPLTRAVIDHAALVERAYEETRKLQMLLEGDFAGIMGSTVTFSDNDGD